MKRLIIPALAVFAAAFAPSVEASVYKWTATVHKVVPACCYLDETLVAEGSGQAAVKAGAYASVIWTDCFTHVAAATQEAITESDLYKSAYLAVVTQMNGVDAIGTTYTETAWVEQSTWMCRLTVTWEEIIAPGGRTIEPGAAGPIPEPTSGLLLLVGAGLLALRRRETIGGAE